MKTWIALGTLVALTVTASADNCNWNRGRRNGWRNQQWRPVQQNNWNRCNTNWNRPVYRNNQCYTGNYYNPGYYQRPVIVQQPYYNPGFQVPVFNPGGTTWGLTISGGGGCR